MLQMGPPTAGWRAAIVRTIASRGEGVGELLSRVEEHRAWLVASGELAGRRRRRLRLRVENLLRERVLEVARETHGLELELARAETERADPYTVAERLFRQVVRRAVGEEER
jgi:LAO/AO transport system kinase